MDSVVGCSGDVFSNKRRKSYGEEWLVFKLVCVHINVCDKSIFRMLQFLLACSKQVSL